MLGFSIGELVIILLLAILVIKPKDLPEIAYFVGKIYYRIKRFFFDAKTYISNAEKEFGLDEIKKEFARAKISEEEERKKTQIIDMYGNVHEVENVDKIRSDLSLEEIENEVKKYNQQNFKDEKGDDKEVKPEVPKP